MSAADVAREVLSAFDHAAQIAPFSMRDPAFGMTAAYEVTAELRRLRTMRGEQPIGRKIGFTNRNIWAQYNVDRPIWGDMYAHTVRDAHAPLTFPLAGLCEPLIEPEIVLKLSRAPAPGMDEPALLDCIEWIAHGFEIVQSIYPGWKFSAADTVAAGGLHGALLLGTPVSVSEIADPRPALSSFRLTLACDGNRIDEGTGANVLGSPVSALRHLVEALAADRFNEPLRAGEIVTTGTVTRAFPIAAGQRWTTDLTGLALPGLSVAFG